MLIGRSSSRSLPLVATGSRDSIPPSRVDGSKHRGTKCTQELWRKVSESTASGFVTKKCKSWNKLPKDEQRTSEARNHCRL